MINTLIITCWIWAYPADMHVPCDEDDWEIPGASDQGSGI